MLRLSRAQSHTQRPYSVMFCRVTNQRAPAAAHVEKAVSRTQSQLPADQIELRKLCFLQRGIRLLEIGATVNKLPVKPQPPEIDRQIVVITDGISCAAFRLAI